MPLLLLLLQLRCSVFHGFAQTFALCYFIQEEEEEEESDQTSAPWTLFLGSAVNGQQQIGCDLTDKSHRQ